MTATETITRRLRAAPLAAADWYVDAVFYEVSVKAFYDSNHDGIGDFAGLTSKLGYLQDLGVTALWLMPFYPSPWLDDGYDIADFRAIHPALGNMSDFQHFLEETHRRGLRVVADLVINHTSNQHPWFQAARSAPSDSPLRDFYLWQSDPKAPPQTGWTWDPVAESYFWHRFADHEPDLNYDNPAVVAEMGSVVRFWMGLGLDGLSLGGASHLVARPAQDREEIPATHAVLRALRREVDQYQGRLLVAGVNAWPQDAAAYYGDGDEVHMTPHLPLAQRLFQALEQEDAHPLVDILEQTPQLPPLCQWLTLLRNHDELTLQLATDEERDYMYRQYAADQQMRRHQGIARRLAPLLSNSRQKLELMLGLLFSLPGSPMIYYGDEIGMGDNVYLGDRSGMRTPMQWTADRNAGFSRADFARLYEPPVMDPSFGYEAVNVESQRRDPSSLFHWLRTLIGLRKRLAPLSRGSLEILDQPNRKVVAMIRRQGEQVVLVVANLARSLQPVTLDLSAHAGTTPVEVFGRSMLPRIGRQGYSLTLGPHAFHWFLLERDPHAVAERLAPVAVEPLQRIPTLELSGEAESLFAGESLAQLEQNVLPGYLKSQRWFGGKARGVQSVRVSQWQRMSSDGPPAFFVFLEVRLATGETHLYSLPLVVKLNVSHSGLPESMHRFVLAEFASPQGKGLLLDALADDDACHALLAAAAEASGIPLQQGRIRGVVTSAWQQLLPENGRRLPIARAGATSSNSLVLFGRRVLTKLFRRIEPGLNPDVEIGRYFTDQHEFRQSPKLAATLELVGDGDQPFTLAIVQEMVANQGDGWEHAIGELGRYYQRASGQMRGPDSLSADDRPLLELAEADPPPLALEAIGRYFHAAAILGRRTGEMHLALAQEDRDPAFSPESLTEQDVKRLIDDVREQSRQVLAAMETNLARLSDEIAAAGESLREQLPGVLKRLERAPLVAAGGMKIRCHGDYHLGQVLWVDNDYVILDFEGEPTRSVEERRAKQSPLRDVAGMLRSYSYAAHAGLFAYAESHPDDFEPLQPWAALWQQWVSAAFLRAYLDTTKADDRLQTSTAAIAPLLKVLLLGKALYELVYELNNRPDWVRIPLTGILQLIKTL